LIVNDLKRISFSLLAATTPKFAEVFLRKVLGVIYLNTKHL
jgi:hypothetical protein